MKYLFQIGLLCFMAMIVSCSSETKQKSDLGNLSWEQITQRAQGQTINMMMWQGDPNINDYMQNYVAPAVKEQYGVDLEVASGQGNTIVSILMSELEAGKSESELDLVWINGEIFYQLRQIDALYGPFVSKLPNAQYLDLDNPFIQYDFQQPINGYEVPWGNVQFAMIYDSTRVQNPPQNRQELTQYVRQHPGTFTIPNDFTGMTFLKSLLISFAGPGTLDGEFDQQAYQEYSSQLWAYLNRIKSHFWKEGTTFPSSVSSMHQLFVNGELNFTMSNNETEVDNKMLEGLFPKSARSYLLEPGTIQNSHYVGIPVNSIHKAGAMVVSNFLISPEAQYRKARPDVWGDGTVLAKQKLANSWASRFADIPELRYTPPEDSLQAHALRELAPEYMIRLYEDFRTEVIQK